MEYKKILINFVLIIFILSTTVFGGTLIDEFEGSISITGIEELQDAGGKILGTIRVIGTIIAVAMIMILGIKYMIGSAEQKAEYKKTLFPYLIGAILIFGASNIADIIYSWAKELLQ